MDNSTSYTKAIVAFGAGAFFLLFAFFSLPMIVFSPYKFTEFFSLAMLALLVGLAFLNGPRSYLKKLTSKANMISTSILFGSMILSLYFSLISSSYILSIVFCIVELNAVALFFCKTFPMGTTGMKIVGQGMGNVLSTPFKN